MAIGYLVLTTAYYSNSFNGRDIVFMSTSLFGKDGSVYNQSSILTPDFQLDPVKLAEVGPPRKLANRTFRNKSTFLRKMCCIFLGYTTTYTISQLAYNIGLGAAITHVFIWHWKELKSGNVMTLTASPSFK